MKTPKFLPSSIALTLLAMSAVSPSAHAATIDWSGGNSASWNTGTNWVGLTPPTPPANNLTTDIAWFNQSTYAFQPTAPTAQSVGGLIFGNISTSTAAVTITTGTNLGRLNVGASGIVMNTHSGAVSIGGVSANAGLQLGASQSWTNNSSSLLTVNTLSGQTAGQNYVLTFDGSGSGGTAITGAILNDYSAVNTGTLSLVINTTGGVTTLSGATNDGFTGDTTLTQGVLALNNTGALARSALNTAGNGTVTTNVTTLTLGGLKGSRNLSSVMTAGYNNVTALTLNPQSGTSTYSGIISNGAATTSLTKAGAGTQELQGANTYTGLTNITGGVLAVTSLGNASVANTLGQSSSSTAANLAFNGGSLQLTGATTTAQSTDRLFTVGVSGGTLDSSAGVGSSMNFTNVGTVTGANPAGNRTLTLTGLRNGSIASIIGQRNNIDSTTSLQKTGSGTWTLSGSNTYTGITNINAGVLGVTSLGNASAASTLGASSNADGNLVFNGGTLQLTGATTAAQSTDRLFTVGVSGGTLDSSAGVGSSMNFTNAGIVTGVNSLGARTLTLTGLRNGSIASIIGQRNNTDSTTSLLKTGNGTWTLSGSNTYTGSTTVSAGTLFVNGSVGGSGVTVQTGGTLGGSGTVSSLVTVNSGGTLSPGTSPGVATYSGGLTLETNSSFTFELAANSTTNRGTDFDGVNVTGGIFNLQSGVNFNLILNGAGSATNYTLGFWDSDRSWLVFDNANVPTISALFALGSVSNDSLGNAFSTAAGGLGAFGFSQVGNDIFLNYTVIPEPSTWLLLIGSLTCIVAMRRFRNKRE